MIAALSTPRNRTVSIIFFAIGIVLATSAMIIGINDNPPGIFMAFGAVAALILAIIHPWRTARHYLRFLIAGIVAFVLFAILHNVFYGLAEITEDQSILQKALQVLDVTSFLIAVLICPPAIVIGAVGSIAVLIGRFRRTVNV